MGGARWHFVAALRLRTISIAAQVLYLELDALKGAARIMPGALDGVPVIGWLVGSNGGGWVVLGRAIGFQVAEAACCFVLAKSTENPEKRMLAMQREQRATQASVWRAKAPSPTPRRGAVIVPNPSGC